MNKRVWLVGIFGSLLFILGCPKELIKMDNPSVVSKSTFTVNVPIDNISAINKSTITVNANANIGSNNKTASNNKVNVSSGAFSNNSANFDVNVSSDTAVAILDYWFKNAKWYHYLFLLLVIGIVAFVAVKFKNRK